MAGIFDNLTPVQVTQLQNAGILTADQAQGLLATKAPPDILQTGTGSAEEQKPSDYQGGQGGAPPVTPSNLYNYTPVPSAPNSTDTATPTATPTAAQNPNPFGSNTYPGITNGGAAIGANTYPQGANYNGQKMVPGKEPEPVKPPTPPEPGPHFPTPPVAAPAPKPAGGGGGVNPAANPFGPGGTLANSNDLVSQSWEHVGDVSKQAEDNADERSLGLKDQYTSAKLNAAFIEAERVRNASIAQAHADYVYQDTKDKIAQLAQTKIDPTQWFKDSSGNTDYPKTIMAAVAQGLGAFGAGVPHNAAGGHNFAMDIIQGAINKNIDAQKSNLQQKWEALTKNTDLENNQMAQQHYMNDQSLRQEAMEWEKVGKYASVQGALSNDDATKAKAAEIGAIATTHAQQAVQATAVGASNWLSAQARAQALANNPDVLAAAGKDRGSIEKEALPALKYESAKSNYDKVINDSNSSNEQRAQAFLQLNNVSASPLKGKELNDTLGSIKSWTGHLPGADSSTETTIKSAAGLQPPATPTLDVYDRKHPGTKAALGFGAGNPAGGTSSLPPGFAPKP